MRSYLRARRAIFSGLASDELAAVHDHLNSLGVEFDFERAEADSRRAIALEVYDESEQWLLDDDRFGTKHKTQITEHRTKNKERWTTVVQ